MGEPTVEGLAGLTAKQRRYVDSGHRMALRYRWGAHLFCKVNRALYRLSGGRVGASMQGVNVGLLTTTGRVSGRERTVPVVCLLDGARTLVAATNSGLDAEPAWCLNLRAQPNAKLRTRSGAMRVVARELNGAEREEGWARLLAYNPMVAGYQAYTNRHIALFALERPSQRDH